MDHLHCRHCWHRAGADHSPWDGLREGQPPCQFRPCYDIGRRPPGSDQVVHRKHRPDNVEKQRDTLLRGFNFHLLHGEEFYATQRR